LGQAGPQRESRRKGAWSSQAPPRTSFLLEEGEVSSPSSARKVKVSGKA